MCDKRLFSVWSYSKSFESNFRADIYKPKTFGLNTCGLETFGQNTSGKKLSDCLIAISDKITFGQVKFWTKIRLILVTRNATEKMNRLQFSLLSTAISFIAFRKDPIFPSQ